MKISIVLIVTSLLLLGVQQGVAQKNRGEKLESEIACSIFAVPAEYPGGMANFIQEFKSRFIFPEEALEENVFQFILQFTVEDQGLVTDIKILRDPGFGIGTEAVRVLGRMSKWKPAIENDKKIESTFTLPLTLRKLESADFLVDTLAYKGVKAFYAQAYYEAGVLVFEEQFIQAYERMKNPLALAEMKNLDVQFIVEVDGSVSQVKVRNTSNEEVRNVVERIVKGLGKWRPAKVNNTVARSYYEKQLFL